MDLKTGARKWRFQFIHHGIWDHDMSSAPLLVDVTVDGKPIKAVAVPSKQGWLYMFDRVSGKPIWPMPETPVPQSDVPGEKSAQTQLIPSKPPAYARTFVKIPDDVIDYTPALRAEGLTLLRRYRTDQSPYVPCILGDVNGLLGVVNIGNTGGGTNWPGAGLDPETKVAYLPAIDLNRGDLMWQVPHGDTPDMVRNHPLLKGLDIPKTGQNGAVCLVITRTLVVLGDPQVTSAPGRPRGAMLRADDKKTGAQVGAVHLPAQ